MYTFYFICLLICLFEFYCARTAKVYTKTRKSPFDEWRKYEWEYVGTKLKFKRITIISLFILFLLPFVNFLTVIAFGIWIICKEKTNPKGCDGWELECTRIVVENKITKWLFTKV